MHYITPDDEASNMDMLSALGAAGFDRVLQGMGEHFKLDGLVCYYASFIAVQHCTGSYPHSDASESDGKSFNLIFPIMQVNESSPELVLRQDDFGPLIVPYRYESGAAIVLGDDGELEWGDILCTLSASALTSITYHLDLQRFIKQGHVTTGDPTRCVWQSVCTWQTSTMRIAGVYSGTEVWTLLFLESITECNT